jgi:hypothetical protein
VHCPVTGKLLGWPDESDGGPNTPVNPFPRVSTIRHGVTEKNWNGPAAEAVETAKMTAASARNEERITVDLLMTVSY